MAKFKKVRQSSPSGVRRSGARSGPRSPSQQHNHPSYTEAPYPQYPHPGDIGNSQPQSWRSQQEQQGTMHQHNPYSYDSTRLNEYQNIPNFNDSPPMSGRSYSGNVRFGPNSSESTLIDESVSGYQTVLPEDSASNLVNRNYMDEKPYNQGGSNNNFLAVPEPQLRQRLPSYAPGRYPGGFDPNARYSSAVSVASSDREATSEAWIKRQRIKPGRAKTKKVKLTKGRFIAEFGKLGC